MLHRLVSAFLIAVAVVTANAESKDALLPRLMPGLGEVHHPVSTKNREAQQFFDQGFKFVYGFNHDEARRSFQRAAELDPKLAMAHWGVALTLGPNYNLPVDPERELPSAARLEKLAPAEGHLAHMPAHIYARVGDHFASAHCNEAAIAADKKFLSETHEQGVYRMMYYSHNLHFLAFASCMNGNLAGAKDAAAKLVANVAPGVKAMPMLEGFLPTPIVVLFAFERWNDILKLPAPDKSLESTSAVWHSLRGIAFANMGKTSEAEQEQKEFRDLVTKIPPAKMYDQLNNVGAVFKIHEHLLAAEIARSQHDEKAAIDSLKQAIAAEDALNYSEPPPWYPPVRPTLGRLLLATNRAPEAEKVFREDLDRNPRDA